MAPACPSPRGGRACCESHTLQTETEERWTLCGQFTGPWVAELRECWERGRQDAKSAHTIVDLSDVTSIDWSGEKLLSQMRSDGAEFIAQGVYTAYLLENFICPLSPVAEGIGRRRRQAGSQAQDECRRSGICRAQLVSTDRHK